MRLTKDNFSSFPALASILTLLIAGAYLLLRYPFETDMECLLKIFLFSLTVINVPYVIYLFIQRRGNSNFYLISVFSMLAMFALTIIAGVLNADIIVFPLLVLGGLSFLVTVFLYFRNFNWSSIVHFLLILVFSFWVAQTVWGGKYLTPLFIEKIIVKCYYGIDSLFHMSIAQMIKTYNVPSTGLDEIPYIPYHFGSHFLFAQTSKLLNVPIPEMYNCGYPVIFIPAFFYLVCIVFHQFQAFSSDRKNFNYLFWFLLFMFFIGFLSISPGALSQRSFFSTGTILFSESYLVSMIFLFMTLSIFVAPLLGPETVNNRMTYLFLVVTLILLIGFTKISSLFIFTSILVFLYFKQKQYRSLFFTLIMFLAGVISLGVYFTTYDSKSPNGAIEYFHFFNEFVSINPAKSGLRNFCVFIILHCFWTFVLMGLWLFLYMKKIKINSALVQLQIAIAFCGLLPGIFLKIYGASAFYFSDIQHWTALFFIAYYLPFLVEYFRGTVYGQVYRFGFLLLIPVFLNAFSSLERLLKDNYMVKCRILGDLSRSVNNITVDELIANRSVFYRKDLTDMLNRNPDFHRLKYLSSLDTLGNKKERILYIPDGHYLLKFLGYPITNFFAVSVTGMSLLNGYSEPFPGLQDYALQYYSGKKMIPPDRDLCKILYNPKFKEVVYLDIQNKSFTLLTCAK